MAQFQNIFPVDLNKGPAVVSVNTMYFGDEEANRIGAVVTRDGEVFNLGGTCAGTVIRFDGTTVAVSGTVSGNTCYIDLPDTAYGVPGPVQIYVSNTANGNTTTLVAAYGTVQATDTGAIAPGVIPDTVADLIDAIEAAVATIPADYSGLWTSLAPAYSTSATYAVGDYVTYNGGLYRCTTAISTAESWTAGHWIQVSFGPDIKGLSIELDKKADSAELDINGASVDVPAVVNGAWSNADVGETITPATNNNARRVIVDLTKYIGWKAEISLVTSINPQITSGTTMYLANSVATASIKFLEKVFANGNKYTYTVSASNAFAYLCYATARSSSNFSVKVTSPKALELAKIPVLEQSIDSAVKPISFTNLCENPNVDDLTGFSVNSAATIAAEDNMLVISTSGTGNAEAAYLIPTPLKSGHIYFCAADMKCNYTGNGLRLQYLALKSGSATQTIGNKLYNGSNPNVWQRLFFVTASAPEYSTMRINVYTNSRGGETIYLKKIVALDLTEIFGAGKEPNAGSCEQIIMASNNGDPFFAGSLLTDIILATPYPNASNDKPIYVGISGFVMNVNAKYSASKDIRYKIGKAGSNSLFNWRGFDFIDNSGQIVSPEVDLAQTVTVITDWFGPHKLKVANNANGDMPNSDNFTGGNHAYDGDSSGTPTARTDAYAFYVDGRKVTEFLGYAYYVDVYWVNYVQATNTKKSDGTGREVLRETFHMHFDGEKWTLDGMLEPLEALASWSYYGIQMSRASAYNGYIFYHDSPDNRTWHSTSSSSNSGTNACHTITMHDGADYFEMHVGTDGLGNFALIGNENSFFSTPNKTYSNLIKTASNIAANSIYTYDGYYKWYNKDFN